MAATPPTPFEVIVNPLIVTLLAVTRKRFAMGLEELKLDELELMMVFDGPDWETIVRVLLTLMVSLYIPANRGLSDFVNELTTELGTAANIRSKTTRKNVTTALQSTLGRLKQMGHKAPESGLAIFAGVTTSGKSEFHLLAPPNSIARKLYVCDSFFHTDFLEDYLEEKDAYGLIAIEIEDYLKNYKGTRHCSFTPT